MSDFVAILTGTALQRLPNGTARVIVHGDDEPTYECSRCHQHFPEDGFYWKTLNNGNRQRFCWCRECQRAEVSRREKEKRAAKKATQALPNAA